VVSCTELDDEVLLTSLLKGDHSAFVALVERYGQKAYVIAYRFVGDRDESEDIVQTAFLKLWERPGMWSPEMDCHFSSWFFRTVVNLCLDWRKKKRPVLNNEYIIRTISKANQEKQLIHTQQQALLEFQIAALPERQRVAINLSYSCGLSNREAAEVMGVSLRSLQSLVMRAKTTIKANLERLV
jgi:RNA polymerase sigma-70 factor (ECF subfamily)